jgi:hypothetical protein
MREEREGLSRCEDVWMVTHGYRGGLCWVKNQSSLCQIRFLGRQEISPPCGLNSACHGFSARFPQTLFSQTRPKGDFFSPPVTRGAYSGIQHKVTDLLLHGDSNDTMGMDNLNQ